MKKESKFQKELIDELEARFPGCIIMKNDSSYIQGIPDLTILHNDRWAMLECKQHGKASHQPNQDYYIQKASEMSYAAFVYPENKTEVLNELERALQHKG